MKPTDESQLAQFRDALARAGLFYTTEEIRYLYSLAVQCSGYGVALGGGLAVYGFRAGPWGAALGALVGFFGGTGACMAVGGNIKSEIDKLLQLRPTLFH